MKLKSHATFEEKLTCGLWFEKLQEEFDKFSSEHLNHGILFSKVENA